MTAVSLQTLHALGWTLLHFVWQGAALAALLAAALTVSRNANVRYALGVGTLIFMVAAPAVTFAWLNRAPGPVASVAMPAMATEVVPASEAVPSSDPLIHVLAATAHREDMMLWLVQAWFVGVMLLAVRTAGGLWWLARTRRGEIEPLSEEMYRQCLILQRRMGLQRHICYGQSGSLDSPVVLGWFRPVVIVTTQALTGLSPQQLQAIIAHELAHIRRHDAFVNLFQIVAEMFLFYHPAVWWVSRRIRIEREVCCDDEALAACGEPVSYARALTMMEEWRAAPSMMMAANRSPLAERVLRLLGMQGASARSRAAGLGACVLGVIAALFAGSVFVAAAQATANEQPSPIAPSEPQINAPPAPFATPEPQVNVSPVPLAAPEPQVKAPPAPVATPEAAPAPRLAAAPEPAPAPRLAAAPERAPAPRLAAAPEPAPAPDPAVASEPAPAPQPATPVQAVPTPNPAMPPRSPEQPRTPIEPDAPKKSSYREDIEATGLRNVSVDQLIAMKVQGITPAYIQSMLATKLRPGVDQLIAMKVHGVTPEYISEARRLVADVSIDHAIAMKVHGITPEYIREMQAAGIDIRIADDFIAAKVQGITPELVKRAVEHGFQDLSVGKLMMLRNIDVI